MEGTEGAEILPQIEVAPDHLVVPMGGVPDRNDFNPFFDGAPGTLPSSAGMPPLACVALRCVEAALRLRKALSRRASQTYFHPPRVDRIIIVEGD